MLLIAQILLPITAHLTFIATKVAANALICSSHNIFYSDQTTGTHTTTTRFFSFHKRVSSVTTSQYGAKALVLLFPLTNNLYYNRVGQSVESALSALQPFFRLLARTLTIFRQNVAFFNVLRQKKV